MRRRPRHQRPRRQKRARILSVYDLGATRLWIITDAEIDGPADPDGLRPRQATTFLLPSEY